METIKTDTNLVTVPVIATSINGLYITDLRKEEFSIAEDGVRHEIAFFGKVSMPFHVILMLDDGTPGQTAQIQQAAYAFVEQLQPADRVKVISFDNQIRELNEFTKQQGHIKERDKQHQIGPGDQGLRRVRSP